MSAKNEFNFSYLIENNRVVPVDNISTTMINDGGKYVIGINYQTSETVQILDKDYGSAKALARELLEEGQGSSKITIRIFSIIAVIVCILFLYFLFKPDNLEKEPQKNNSLTNNLIKTDTIQVKGNIDTSTGQNLNITTVTATGSEQPFFNQRVGSGSQIIAKQIQDSQVELANIKAEVEKQRELMAKDKQNMELSYSYDSINLEKKNLEIEKKALEKEKTDLEGENADLRNAIIEQKEQLKEYEKKQNNIQKEDFIIYLGTQIYNKCETTTDNIFKKTCQELYYGYVSNN